MPVLLCDLDDTLFDHQHATRAALARLQRQDARLQAWPLDELDARHRELLERFHREVLAGRLTIDRAREQRFSALVGGDGAGLAQAYREAYLVDWQEVAGATDLLSLARERGWSIVVVTNNLVSEQRLKLARLNLTSLVDVLVTSEEVGAAKPAPVIFERALDAVAATASDAVMLGDAWETDVVGAQAAGIPPVWLNRTGAPIPDASVAELRTLTPVNDALERLAAAARNHVNGLRTHTAQR